MFILVSRLNSIKQNNFFSVSRASLAHGSNWIQKLIYFITFFLIIVSSSLKVMPVYASYQRLNTFSCGDTIKQAAFMVLPAILRILHPGYIYQIQIVLSGLGI